MDHPSTGKDRTATIETSAKPKSFAAAIRILLILVGSLIAYCATSDQFLYIGEPGFGLVRMTLVFAGFVLALCALFPATVAGNILLIAISSLLMLAFAEIAGEMLLGPRYRPIYQPDDRLIFKFIPNRRSVMTRTAVNGGEAVEHHINSKGFRGGELEPAGKATRIVVYGDSFIHAFYTSQSETFAARLGSNLGNRLGGKIEVINAGVSSYGPDQVSLKMEDELPWLRPDLVIVAIFAGNDYGDLMRNKIFRLGADGSLVENRWSLDPQVRAWFALGQKESILKRAFRDLKLRLVKSDGHGPNPANMEFLLKEANREYRNYVVESNDVVTNTHMDYYSAAVSLTPESASARYEIGLMGGVMRRIRDVAAARKVPIAFLFIPHPFDVTEKYDDWKVDRQRFPGYASRNQIAPLENAAQALDVPYVSLYDLYRTNDANSLYFHEGDDHWNAAGQQMAASAMADYLIAQKLPAGGKGR